MKHWHIRFLSPKGFVVFIFSSIFYHTKYMFNRQWCILRVVCYNMLSKSPVQLSCCLVGWARIHGLNPHPWDLNYHWILPYVFCLFWLPYPPGFLLSVHCLVSLWFRTVVNSSQSFHGRAPLLWLSFLLKKQTKTKCMLESDLSYNPMNTWTYLNWMPKLSFGLDFWCLNLQKKSLYISIICQCLWIVHYKICKYMPVNV